MCYVKHAQGYGAAPPWRHGSAPGKMSDWDHGHAPGKIDFGGFGEVTGVNVTFRRLSTEQTHST